MNPYPELTEHECRLLDDLICPNCGHGHFMAGPRGGMCQNIQCKHCHSKFNIVPGLVGSFGKERISEPSRGHRPTPFAPAPFSPLPPVKKIPEWLPWLIEGVMIAVGAALALTAWLIL